MNQTLDRISKWARDWKLTFSKSKSNCLVLSRRTREPDWKQNPILNGEPLPTSKHPRILGLTLDAKLSWTEHIETIQKTANRKLNVLRRYAGETHAKRTNLRTLYLSFVRPTLEYGSACWKSAAEFKLKKLERIQNSALRLITGGAISTPINVLEADTNIPPLELRWEQDLFRTVIRNLRDDTTTASRKLNQRAQNGAKNSPTAMAGRLLHRLFPNPIPHSSGTPPPVPPQPPSTNIEQTPTKPYQILFRDATKHLKEEWYTKYKTSRKGEHYKNLRPTILPIWPHTDLNTYRQSVTIFRMRSGHNNLGAHTRTNQSKNCEKCNNEDTVEHLLLQCPAHKDRRQTLFKNITALTKSRRISTALLLGSLNEARLPNKILKNIAIEVAKFVLETRPDI